MDPTQFPPTLEPPLRLPLVSLLATMLAPPLILLGGMIYSVVGGGGSGLLFLNALWFISIVCWMLFGYLLRPRYRGPSFWLMFFAYPFAQLSIVLAIGAAAYLISLRL